MATLRCPAHRRRCMPFVRGTGSMSVARLRPPVVTRYAVSRTKGVGISSSRPSPSTGQIASAASASRRKDQAGTDTGAGSGGQRAPAFSSVGAPPRHRSLLMICASTGRRRGPRRPRHAGVGSSETRSSLSLPASSFVGAACSTWCAVVNSSLNRRAPASGGRKPPRAPGSGGAAADGYRITAVR